MNLVEFIELNIPLYRNLRSKRFVRHNFFSVILTELLAYLLGIIASDGCINIKRSTLTLHINKIDCELFDLFKIISPDAYINYCKPTTSIATVRGHTVSNNGSIRLSIYSKQIIEDLCKLGISENKTYKEMYIMKNIPINLRKHFIRGYFDGDGCITYYVLNVRKNNKKYISVKACFSIYAKMNNILYDIKSCFENNNLNLNIHYYKRDDMYIAETSSKYNIYNVFHYLYDNSNFYLSRKFNKFNYYANTEVSQIISDHRNALKVSVNESNNPSTSAGISI